MSNPLAVVTGASSGIGQAIAKKLSDQGYSLLLLARSFDKSDAKSLPNALYAPVDVTNESDFSKAVNEAVKAYGAVECLVNCEGLMLLGDIADQSPSEWRQMLDVNVLGLTYGMQIVLKSMKQRNSGTIVNISSIAGIKTFPNHAAYCGTKFAVHAISEAVREEVAGNNVRVVTIAPGVVETPLLSHTTSDAIKSDYTDWKKSIGGGLEPNNVADAVYFAVSQPQSVCIREIVLAPTGQAS
ncbi:MAG: SDR family oxidoreductase [Cellvibrionales bacterium]|nr:SDR family oxidoreductase [Cellvibrionales bacterium]